LFVMGTLRRGDLFPAFGRCEGARLSSDGAPATRLLNHSRFPTGRAHGFAAPLWVALGFTQVPTGHTLPSAPATVALADYISLRLGGFFICA